MEHRAPILKNSEKNKMLLFSEFRIYLDLFYLETNARITFKTIVPRRILLSVATGILCFKSFVIIII